MNLKKSLKNNDNKSIINLYDNIIDDYLYIGDYLNVIKYNKERLDNISLLKDIEILNIIDWKMSYSESLYTYYSSSEDSKQLNLALNICNSVIRILL